MSDPSNRHVDWLKIIVPLGRREPFQIPEELLLPEREQLFDPLMAHIDVHLAQGNHAAAGELLRLSEHLFDHDSERIYRIRRKQVRWLEVTGRASAAIELLEQLAAKYKRNRRAAHRSAELTMEQGILLDRLGHKKAALKHFREAIQRYKRLGHTYNYTAAIFNSASVLFDLQRPDESLNACIKALEEGAQAFLDLRTHITLQMANCHESKHSEEVSQDHYVNAAQGYEQMGNRKNESDILYRLGWMALKQRRFPEAAQLLQRALELKREIDYGTGLALYHFYRAEAYRNAGIFRKALGHYRTCLSLALLAGQDSLGTQARFGLYRCCGSLTSNLPGFLKLPPPPGAEGILGNGRSGLYSNHLSEGFRTYRLKESGPCEPAHGDRVPLARLMGDLAQVQKRLGVPAHQALEQQSGAVWRWTKKHHGR